MAIADGEVVLYGEFVALCDDGGAGDGGDVRLGTGTHDGELGRRYVRLVWE